MPAVTPEANQYPIPFVPNDDGQIKAALGEVGLVEGEERTERVRNHLVRSGLVFALIRPVSQQASLLHPGYLRAALQAAPKITDASYNNGDDKWTSAITSHLSAFATRAVARDIIGDGLATYYGQISEAVTDVSNGQPYMPVSAAEEGEMPPIRYIVGTSSVPALLGLNDPRNKATTTRQRGKEGRMYFPLMPVMSNTAWWIPGVESVDTWHHIMDKFTEVAAARGNEPLVDPRALFMAGKLLRIEDNTRVAVPIRGFFSQ